MKNITLTNHKSKFTDSRGYLFIVLFLSYFIANAQDIVYTFDTSTDGWNNAGGTTVVTQSSGNLSVGGNINNYGGTKLSAQIDLVGTEFTSVELQIKNLTSFDSFQLLSYLSGGSNAGSAGKTNFTVTNNDQFQTITVVIPTSPNSNGKITRLGIRILGDPPSGESFLINTLTIKSAVCTGSAITTAIGAAGGGTAAITSPNSDNCYSNGTDVEVTAVACGGFAFSKWEIDINGVATESTDNPLTYSVTATTAVVEIKAIFVASAAVPDTNFNTNAELSNWAVNGNSTAIVAANNLTWSITGDTPKLIYNVCSFAPETWGTSHLKIGYTNQTSNTRLRFAIPKVGGSAFINFDGMAIAGDGTSGVGEIDALIRNDNWTGTLTQLEFIIKLNSVNGAADQGDFVIDYIEFYNGFETTGNGVWNTAATWVGNDVPTVLDNVQINHNISIGTTTGAAVKNLDVDASAALTIASGGSLIVSGTSTGNLTYNVGINDTNWHLISSPVVGEQYNAAWITANNISSGTTDTDNRGISTYDNGTANGVTGHWRYYQEALGDLTFESGKGYSLKRTSGTDYGFTGTYKTDNLLMTISQDVNNWNLVGNPYPSYLLVSEIISDNTLNLTDTHEFIYVWDNNKVGGAGYSALTGTDYIHPGQAFFVNAANSTANNFTITEPRQSHQTGETLYKTSLPSIKLFVKDANGELEYTELEYKLNATLGLDRGLDAGTFTGVSSNFSLYSHLVDNNEGVDFMRQVLPNSDLESMVIPIGVNANAGKEITFSAEALNLPDGIKVFLEDRLANTFNELSDNKTFKVNLSEALNDVGRFYLHTSSNALSIDDSVILENVSIYKTNASTLKIVGLPNGIANIKLINVLGKQLMNTSFNANGAKEISLPNLAAGIYIVQLETEFSKLNKKIVLE